MSVQWSPVASFSVVVYSMQCSFYLLLIIQISVYCILSFVKVYRITHIHFYLRTCSLIHFSVYTRIVLPLFSLHTESNTPFIYSRIYFPLPHCFPYGYTASNTQSFILREQKSTDFVFASFFMYDYRLCRNTLAWWVVGWVAGWLVGWLGGWLAGWLCGWSRSEADLNMNS